MPAGRQPLPGTPADPFAKPPARPTGPLRPPWGKALGGLIIGKLLRELTSSNDAPERPIVPFRARLHRWDGEKYVYETDRLLDEEEATKLCPELKPVREMLDDALNEAGPPVTGRGAGPFASRVHGITTKAIEKYNEKMRRSGTPEKQLGRPEQSIRKDGMLIERFEKGTIRPDLNNRHQNAWCALEYKVSIGAAVDDERMDELAIRLSKARSSLPRGETPEYLVVIEVKPHNPPELRSPLRLNPRHR